MTMLLTILTTVGFHLTNLLFWYKHPLEQKLLEMVRQMMTIIIFLNKTLQLFETLVPLAWILMNKPFRKFCLHHLRWYAESHADCNMFVKKRHVDRQISQIVKIPTRKDMCIIQVSKIVQITQWQCFSHFRRSFCSCCKPTVLAEDWVDRKKWTL